LRHELIKKCVEDELEEEQKKRYHNRAADFYLKLFKEQRRLREKEKEDNYNNSSSANKLDQRSYEIAIGCANHLHNAGRHEESYTHNQRLADYASTTIGDLDFAERCYKMAIEDTEKLGNLEGKMLNTYKLSWGVYFIWGRYDEALDNYQYVLKYYEDIKDRSNKSSVLVGIANIYSRRGEYDAALAKHNESLEIRRQIGDQNGIATSLNNIGSLLIRRGKYEEALPHILQAHDILQRLHIPVGFLLNNLTSIKNALGEEKYEKLVSNADLQ